MGDFKKLEVWQRSKDVAVKVYRISSSLPDGERFGLQSQVRRAAVSIVSNIAEGSGRRSDAYQVQYFSIARGSAAEVESLLIIAMELQMFDGAQCQDLLCEVRRVNSMLLGLIRALRPSH